MAIDKTKLTHELGTITKIELGGTTYELHDAEVDALVSEVEKVEGRVTTTESKVASVETRLQTVEAKSVDVQDTAVAGEFVTVIKKSEDGKLVTERAAVKASDVKVDGDTKTVQAWLESIESTIAILSEGENSEYISQLGALIDEVKNGNGDGFVGTMVDKLVGLTGTVAEAIATAKTEATEAAASDASTKADKALLDAKAYVDGKGYATQAAVEAKLDASAVTTTTVSGYTIKCENGTLSITTKSDTVAKLAD